MAPPPDAPADAVLWQEQVELPVLATARADAPLSARVDVAVVGGGYAGLAAAIEIARGGRSVRVYEKGELGWGAHSRNGGMAIPELKAGPASLQAKYGDLGLRMHREVNEAFDHLEGFIADELIDCDYERTGQLYLAHSPRLVPYLRDLAQEHAVGFGEPVHFVERDALVDEIGSTAFHGAVVYERTGGLHPAKLHAGLVAAALGSGVEIVDRCAATHLDDRGSGTPGGRFGLATERGPVHADHVIITTNAYADGLVPELAKRVLPIGSFIVATEPLSAEVAAAVSPRHRMFVNTKNLLFYWRLSPDGRMLFGGRRSLQHATVAEAADYLAASMREIHPQLAEVAVTHRWGGNVAVTLDRMPHVGQVRGAWYATGCNGSGVALNTWLGHRLGLVVLGHAPPPSFAELKHRPIPVHRARKAYLPLVGQWFRYQDRP
ncbi:NAD(P)/FAD-dependent oxidoreductase [Aquihabitans sp. McL0605]|uniref:NAD(P)/FAD-dependent oxidoreductase n=1 Tax=Aquihabitans sp. McL0605 TaxID=3415671 RepID=UPI003CE817EB